MAKNSNAGWKPPDRLGYSSMREVRLTAQGIALSVIAACLIVGAFALGIFLARTVKRETLEQRLLYDRQVYQAFASYPESAHIFQLDVPGQNIGGMVLKPWDQRRRTTMAMTPSVQQAMNAIAGQQIATFAPPALPGGVGLPVQFIIDTTEPFEIENCRNFSLFCFAVPRQLLPSALAERPRPR